MKSAPCLTPGTRPLHRPDDGPPAGRDFVGVLLPETVLFPPLSPILGIPRICSMPVTRHTSPAADSRNSANLRKYGSDVQRAQLACGTGVPILLSGQYGSRR